MTYTEAIRMALSGDERGYTFLYEETYKSKMYLAIQYMKNKDDAMDILQDAYVKAFAKLDTLQDPEKFPSWFGMIVANTAKNALVKKNPVLFTDISTDPDVESFEYSIEDEDLSHQPELSYTSEETRLLVREMMDALSEEQRVCVLMFHIDGIPIKEIAETLGCSENTVKSRLNYARKNIRKQGEVLQKKGYQLYGIAPFTLLLLLLHKDAYAMSGEADFLAAGAKVEYAVLQNGSSFVGEAAGKAMAEKSAAAPAGKSAASSAMGDAAAGEGASTGTGAASSAVGNAAAGTTAKTAAGVAVKSAFLSTVAGKITIGVIGAALIGGAAFGASQVVQNNQDRNTSAVVQEADGTGTLSSETVPETVSGVAVETESELETELETMFETELLPAETESETELLLAETESETKLIVETESETIAETEMESETKIELSTELQTELLAESETELQTETETGTESETQTEAVTETESESESETESEIVVETETETESESESEMESETESESETETIAETESEDTPVVQAVSLDELSDLLEGNLTKEELEFVLAYGSVSLLGNYSQDDFPYLYFSELRTLCSASSRIENLLTDMGESTIDWMVYNGYLVSEVNRLISVYLDFPITEDYCYYRDTGELDLDVLDAYVEGDIFWVSPMNLLFEKSADITEILISGEDLIVYYDYCLESWSENSDVTVSTASQKAVFQKNENGKYQIKKIYVLSMESETEAPETETESESEITIEDDEYPELLEGGLTKEEFQLVLAGVSYELTGSELSVKDYCTIMKTLCQDSDENNVSLTVMGYREKLGLSDRTEYLYIGYSVSEIDRLFSVFTDFRFDQGKFYSPISGVTVDGDTIWIGNGTDNVAMTTAITGAGYLEDQLIIYFDCYENYTDIETEEVTVSTTNRKAILELNENGKYQICRIAYADDWLEQTMNPEEETEEEVQVQTITDDEYSALLEGNLAKEELEFVLARLATGNVESNVVDYTYDNYLRAFCWQENSPLEFLEKVEDGHYSFDLNEVNRLFSVLTDYQFSEGDDENSDYYIIGDSIWLLYCLFHEKADAVINAACVDGDTMVVSYTYHGITDSAQTTGLILGDLTEIRIAVLEKDENGLFRIVYNEADYTASKMYPELAAVIKALTSIQPDGEETAESETDTLVETGIRTELQSETMAETGIVGQTELEPEQVLIIGADMETESETESESGDTAEVKTAADDDYPDLLEGALTKAELEFVLTYGPEEMTEDGLTEQEFYYILVIFCSAYNDPAFPLTYLGYNSEYASMFSVDGFDRLFSVFTDFRVMEDYDRNATYGVIVDGNTLYLYPATLSYDSGVTITEAFYSEDKMILYYDYHREYIPEAEADDFTVSKAAVLEKNANGNFQIVRITDAASVSTDELYAASGTESESISGSEETVVIIGEDTGSSSDTGMTDEIRALYEQVLQDVADGKYSFPSAEGCNIEGYYYFVADMDDDGSPELVVGVQYTHDDTDVFYWYDCLVFDVEAGSLVRIGGDIELLSVFIPADGSCFYAETEFLRGTGMAYIDQVTIQDSALQSDYVYELFIQDDAYTQFLAGNPLAEWMEISDLTGLDYVQ